MYKELFSVIIKRDSDDFSKIKSWFEDHSPFKTRPQLIVLESGLTDDKNIVTCDRAEEIGASIQRDPDGKTFSNISFKRKKHVATLQSLHSSVKIGNENVTINQLTLFLRLRVVIERKTENKIKEYFNDELCPYPMSLFKDGVMRSAKK